MEGLSKEKLAKEPRLSIERSVADLEFTVRQLGEGLGQRDDRLTVEWARTLEAKSSLRPGKILRIV